MSARYEIISDCDLDALAQRVEDSMRCGWEPHGAPFVVLEYHSEFESARPIFLICQAMVRSRPLGADMGAR